MDKRQTDRLTISPITKQLVDFVINKWIERMVKSIQYQANQTIKGGGNMKEESWTVEREYEAAVLMAALTGNKRLPDVYVWRFYSRRVTKQRCKNLFR